MQGIIFSIFCFSALLFSFISPFIGLYGFTVMLYLKPGVFSLFLAKIHIMRIVGIATFIALFVHKGKKDKLEWFGAIQSKWLITLVGFLCLSMLTSIWHQNTVTALKDFSKIIIAYFLVINLVDSPKRYWAIVWAMIFSALYIGGASIHQYYAIGDFGRMRGAFYGALFGDPNDLAMCFIMLLPFLYFGLFRKKNFVIKLFSLAIIGIFLWGFILVQSRGGLLGLCAMLLVLWMRSKKKVVVLAFLSIVLVGMWNFAPQEYRTRMLSIQTASEDDAASISRLDAWKAGFGMMTHRVFGVGLANFSEGFVHYRPPGSILDSRARQAAHNMFIQIGGEAGFPGLIVFCLFIISGFKAFDRVKKKLLKNTSEKAKEIRLLADATYLSLFGYCAAGMFLSQANNFVLYYLIAFSVVLEKFADQEKIENGK